MFLQRLNNRSTKTPDIKRRVQQLGSLHPYDVVGPSDEGETDASAAVNSDSDSDTAIAESGADAHLNDLPEEPPVGGGGANNNPGLKAPPPVSFPKKFTT